MLELQSMQFERKALSEGFSPVCGIDEAGRGPLAAPVYAAASILAKVSRDRYMEEMDALYPQYQFAKHKGYGTKLHVELLRQYGPCPIHRRSFLKKILSPEELAQYEHQQ